MTDETAPLSSQDIMGGMKTLLDDFKVELKKDLDEQVSGVTQLVTTQADRTVAAQELTRRQVVHLTTMTYSLWRNVRGSDPPPPPLSESENISFVEAAKDLTEEVGKHAAKASTQVNQIAANAGRLLAVETQVGELLKLQKEQMGKKDPKDTRGAIARLADGFAWALKEREGQKFTMIVIGGITSLITALGTTYALMTGRLPMPTQPVHSPPALVAPTPGGP